MGAVKTPCRGAVRVAAKPWSADPRRMANRTRILMIGGAGRSGSTLCDMLLGAAPGAVAVGESVAIWGYGVVENGLCSCGAPFLDCPFWSAVGKRAFGGWDAVVAQRYDGTEGEWPGVRRVLRKRILGPRKTPMRTEVAGIRARLYGAIAEVSGCEVIVDSSKHPYFSYELSELEGFETRMVHLVRDPRATVFSWRRPKLSPQPLRQASHRWLAVNVATELAWLARGRRLHIKYETLASRPGPTMQRLLRFAGLPPAPLAELLRDHEHHLIRGNPIRFERGERRIELDDEWRRAMPFRRKLAVTWRTWPLMVAYGYAPWFGLRASGSSDRGA